MENMEVLEVKMYEKAVEGYSVTGNMVEVIGEQLVRYNGKVFAHYLYNIVGYTAKNGKPFACLKANIAINK